MYYVVMAHQEWADYYTALQDLWRNAGTPSSRNIQVIICRTTDRDISHTTVNDVIQGRRIPAFNTLEVIVQALGGDIEQFRKLWVDLIKVDSTVPHMPTIGARVAGRPNNVLVAVENVQTDVAEIKHMLERLLTKP